jgi:hypothetical protein
MSLTTVLKTVLWNPDERRPRAAWRVLAYFILIVIGSQVVLGVALVGVALVMAAVGQGLDLSDEVGLSLVAAVIAGPLVVVGSLLMALWPDRRLVRPGLGLQLDRAWWLDCAFGLVLGAALMAVIFAVELALGWVEITGTFSPGLFDLPPLLALLGAAVLFLMVGIYEEVMARGYLLRNLSEGAFPKQIGPRAATLIGWAFSSSIFGLLHALNPNASTISTVNLIVAGFFLGLAPILTGRIGLAIGLHITWNFFQGNVFGFPVSGNGDLPTVIDIQQGGPELWTGGAFGPEAGLLGLAAIAVGSLLILAWTRWREGQLRVFTNWAVYDKK